MSGIVKGIRGEWETSSFARWIRNYRDLPAERAKLSEYASILHQQAKDTVLEATFVGLMIGTVSGSIVAALVVVLSKFAALVDAHGLEGFLDAFFSGAHPGAGAAWFWVTAIGAWLGFYLGDQRAFQLRAVATIALAIDRVERKLDTLALGAELPESEGHSGAQSAPNPGPQPDGTAGAAPRG
jgi:hypothetical protein